MNLFLALTRFAVVIDRTISHPDHADCTVSRVEEYADGWLLTVRMANGEARSLWVGDLSCGWTIA